MAPRNNENVNVQNVVIQGKVMVSNFIKNHWKNRHKGTPYNSQHYMSYLASYWFQYGTIPVVVLTTAKNENKFVQNFVIQAQVMGSN
jgi:hypothetical protein